MSGAHLNAAVTLGLAVSGKFPWRYVPADLLSQVVGAVLDAGATWAAFGSAVRNRAHLGATTPAAGVGDGRAFVVETMITFVLVFMIVAVATDTRVPAAVAAPAIVSGTYHLTVGVHRGPDRRRDRRRCPLRPGHRPGERAHRRRGDPQAGMRAGDRSIATAVSGDTGS